MLSFLRFLVRFCLGTGPGCIPLGTCWSCTRSLLALVWLVGLSVLMPGQLLAQPVNGPACSIFTNRTTGDGLGRDVVRGVFVQGNTVYAATSNGLSISTDGGQSFTNKTTANSGLASNSVNGVYDRTGTIYAATFAGLAISINSGQSFMNYNADNRPFGSNIVNGVYVQGSNIYAATQGGLAISNNNAQSFTNKTTANSGLGNNSVLGVYAVGNTIYAATNGGLSISTDGGQSFTNYTTANSGLASNSVLGVYAVGSTVYAVTDGGLSISTDGGLSFTNKTNANGLGSNIVSGVYAVGSTVYAATGGGLSISTDGGLSFTNYTTANGLGDERVSEVYVQGNTVYAATQGGLSYCSSSPPTISGLAANPNFVCTGSPVTFTATVGNTTGSYSYTLTRGDGSLLSGTTSGSPFSQSLVATGSGSQTYTLTVTTGGGTATASSSLTVNSQSPEYQALVDFYTSTNGANWSRKDNWLTGCSPCGWYGVGCNSNGRVTSLNLNGNQLSGSIPLSLSALTNLQVLNLSDNRLSGPIPANLASLSNLQSTLLNNNQLSGCFPASLSALCGKEVNFGGNPNLPGGGNFAAFCASGAGSDAFLPLAAASPNPVCVGSPVSLTVSAGSSYAWSGPEGFAASTQSPGFTPASTASSGVYSVTVGNGSPTCTATASVSLTVGNPPTATLMSSGTLTCTQTSVTLTASGGSSYTFTSSEGQVLGTPGPGNTLAVNSAGAYNVRVANAGGCVSTTSITVARNAEVPSASLSASPSTTLTCAQTSLTLTAGGGGTYAFSGGVVSGNQTVVSGSGLYSVTVVSANGCSAVASVSVSQDNTAPVATISGNLTVVSGGSTVLTAAGGSSLTWSTGQTSASISVMAGVYSVTVATANGCTSSTSVTVTVANQAPIATTNASQTATVGQAFSYTVAAFSDAETSNGLTYIASISPANGLSFDPTRRVISGTPSEPGPVSVTITATDPGGLSASTRFIITVEAAPVVVTPLALTLTASPTTILTTGTTTLLATVSGGTPGSPERPYSYTFTGPGTILTSDNTAQVTNLPAGVQTFTVVASDATQPVNQTISATVSVTVNAPSPVNTAPVATTNANQMATVGMPFAYTVAAFSDAETPGSLTYTASISPATGLSFDAATRVISGTPSLSGVATVNITATDPGGLSASTSFAITVSASAVTPTSPATLTITNFSCNYTNSMLSGVNFVVGYSNGTFSPALPNLFINGVTITGQLGTPYTLGFDGNQSFLPIQDNASRSTYFVWDFRQACASGVGPMPTAPVAPVLANQTATVGAPFSYVVPAFGGTAPIAYAAAGLPAGLSFDATSRTISGTASGTGVSTVVISASNAAGQSGGQFTITVSESASQPTGPASLTITSFNCFSTNGALSSVDFVVGYRNGTFSPPVAPLFIVGVTASGQLGVPYRFSGFDGNVTSLPVADNASRSTYFVWDFRQACAGPVTPLAPTAPVAPVLANQTASVGTPFRYQVPAFSGTQPITYSASGLPAGLSFDASSRIISGIPSLRGVSTVVILASNPAGQGSGQFTLTVSGSPTQPPVGSQPLSLLAPLYDCGTGSFTFQTSGGDGSPVEYFAVGITGPTGVAGPYVVRPAGDAQPFTLRARQAGVEVTYVWDFKAVCPASARLGAIEVAQPWTLRSVGNPVTGELVVEVVGAEGESLQLQLTDLNGRLVESRLIVPTTARHREVFRVSGQGAGILLLQAQSATRRQSLKVLKQ